MRTAILRIIGISFIVGVIATITCVILAQTNSTNETKTPETVEAKPDPKITGANAKYLFAGTTFWGRRTNQAARASELGVTYPFSQLNTLDRESYQAWIAGLECPVTANGHNYKEEESIFKFNCDPDYLPEAAKYFDAFLLGNNHAGNQGKAGLDETRKNLADNGIQYFGTPKRTAANVSDPEYPNDDPAINNCDIVVLPIIAKYDNDETKELKFPFGFCSAHGVYGVPGDDYQQNIKAYAEVVPTIAMPHMGAEYKATHDTIRQNLYRRFIDYGVESVIADHPHWTQDTEAYNGKLIVYSMGNFMFDQTFNKEVSRSAAIEARAEISADSAAFEQWNELGESCLQDKTTCFDKIKQASLSKPIIKWTYDYHGTTSANDRITRLATPAEQAEIGQRLNWTATMQALGQ